MVTIHPRTCKDPITMIGEFAGICSRKDTSDPQKNYRRGLDCIKHNHGRALEYPDVYANISGYSARVLREWYTHIGCLPTRLQSSTRYIDYTNFDYVIPPEIEKNPMAKQIYMNCVKEVSNSISNLKMLGVPNEDASMLLPMCYQSSMVDKRNFRNIIDMSRNRLCHTANWEYRDRLMKDYIEAISNYSDEWKTFVELTIGPKCKFLGYCPEGSKKTCGRYPTKD